MNCRYAREIINLVIDGEGHPLAAEAKAHVAECESCREWNVGMEQALGLLQSAEAPPMPDIAAMVMSKLPAQHPASTRQALTPQKALSWLGAGWLVGAAVLAILMFAILPTLNIDGLGHGISVAKTILSPVSTALGAVRATASVLGHGALGVGKAIGLGPALGVPLFIDLILVAIVFLVRHRRQLAVNACLI